MSLTPCIQDTRTKIPHATTSEVRSGPLSSNESSAGLFAFRHMDRLCFPAEVQFPSSMNSEPVVSTLTPSGGMDGRNEEDSG